MKMKNLLNVVVMLASVQVFAVEQKLEILAQRFINDARPERPMAVLHAATLANIDGFGDRVILDEKTLNSAIKDMTDSGMQYSHWKLASAQAYVHSVLEGHVSTDVIFEKDYVSNFFHKAVTMKDLATVLAAAEIWGANVKDFGEAFSTYADGHDGWDALVIDMMKDGALIPSKEEISAAIISFYVPAKMIETIEKVEEPKQDL